MRRRARRDVEVAGLSFLDCICCGFGAVVLLLVIVKVHDPVLTEEQQNTLVALIASLEAQLLDIEEDTRDLEEDFSSAKSEAEMREAEAERLAAQLAELQGAVDDARRDAIVAEAIEKAAKRAEQSLTTDAERNRNERRSQLQNVVGGIPADSEYVIFVIDTSGSMTNYNWHNVVQKVEETLDIYPKVKGIQVMNDMGNYMFSQYRRRWIPDSPTRRRLILQRLATWRSTSNSSPVEGIEEAIRAFHSWDKEISIYVLGDEFAGSSPQRVIDRVRSLNRPDAKDRRRVRIHGIGFTVDTNDPGFLHTNRRFSMLMRRLCFENGGTFVGL